MSFFIESWSQLSIKSNLNKWHAEYFLVVVVSFYALGLLIAALCKRSCLN